MLDAVKLEKKYHELVHNKLIPSIPILTIKRENASRKQDGSIGFFDDLRKNIIWQYAATRGKIWCSSDARAGRVDQKPVRTLKACNNAFM